MKSFPHFNVMAHPIEIASNVDDMAVVQDSIDKIRRYDFVTENLAPCVESPRRSVPSLVLELRKSCLDDPQIRINLSPHRRTLAVADPYHIQITIQLADCSPAMDGLPTDSRVCLDVYGALLRSGEP
jgi:hypothetical protein